MGRRGGRRKERESACGEGRSRGREGKFSGDEEMREEEGKGGKGRTDDIPFVPMNLHQGNGGGRLKRVRWALNTGSRICGRERDKCRTPVKAS